MVTRLCLESEIEFGFLVVVDVTCIIFLTLKRHAVS